MEAATPPPIDPSQIPHQPARWPKTIAIIAITLGTLGVLQSASGPIILIFLEGYLEDLMNQGGDPEQVATYLSEIKSLSVYSSIGMGAVAVPLLVGGILLLKKRKSAPLVLQIWSVLKILVGGYFTFRNASLSRLQMDITIDPKSFGSGRTAEILQMVLSITNYAALILGILWIAALPVFFLIWFLKENVKSEIARW